MTAGLSLDYAQARCAARYARRPDRRLRQQLRACRSVAAQLDALRASPAAAYAGGIDADASLDDIEAALRRQFRQRVAELAGWAPDEWRAAVGFVRHLVDLPALLHLAETADAAADARWLRADPVLAPFAVLAPAARRAALAAAHPWLAGWLAGADAPQAPARRVAGRPVPASPHPLLAAWLRGWRQTWPACGDETRAPLDALQYRILQHLQRFGALPAGEAGAARAALAAALVGHWRRATLTPAALFAWLALLALDLESLRAAFVRCAAAALLGDEALAAEPTAAPAAPQGAPDGRPPAEAAPAPAAAPATAPQPDGPGSGAAPAAMAPGGRA